MLVLVAFISNAQTKTNNNRPVVTKGYYAIGNHSEKLPAAVALKAAPATTQPVVQKGYYSLESNRKKLPTSYVIEMPKRRATVTKGYYGIGDNHQKLK